MMDKFLELATKFESSKAIFYFDATKELRETLEASMAYITSYDTENFSLIERNMVINDLNVITTVISILEKFKELFTDKVKVDNFMKYVERMRYKRLKDLHDSRRRMMLRSDGALSNYEALMKEMKEHPIVEDIDSIIFASQVFLNSFYPIAVHTNSLPESYKRYKFAHKKKSSKK